MKGETTTVTSNSNPEDIKTIGTGTFNTQGVLQKFHPNPGEPCNVDADEQAEKLTPGRLYGCIDDWLSEVGYTTYEAYCTNAEELGMEPLELPAFIDASIVCRQPDCGVKQ